MKKVLLGLLVAIPMLLSGCATTTLSSLDHFSMPNVLPKQSPMLVHRANICNAQHGYYMCHQGYIDKKGNEVYLQTTRTCITYTQNGWFTWGGSSSSQCQYGTQIGPAIPVGGNPYYRYYPHSWYGNVHHWNWYLPSSHW